MDRSLVVRIERDESNRYGFLETIHAYAQEHLEESQLPVERHAEFYIARAERLSPLIDTDRTRKTLNDYEADLDNYRAAMDFLHSSGRSVELCRLVAALRRPTSDPSRVGTADQAGTCDGSDRAPSLHAASSPIAPEVSIQPRANSAASAAA